MVTGKCLPLITAYILLIFAMLQSHMVATPIDKRETKMIRIFYHENSNVKRK